MKCRYFCRLPLDISPVYLTRGISNRAAIFIHFCTCIRNFCMSRRRPLFPCACSRTAGHFPAVCAGSSRILFPSRRFSSASLFFGTCLSRPFDQHFLIRYAARAPVGHHVRHFPVLRAGRLQFSL